MKHTLPTILVALAASWITPQQTDARNLVILTTNDTHSQIDPDDEDNLGGVLRRKNLIDSVKAAEGPENVMLVDLGDIVQGTLYFHLYGGEVENKVMNYLDYDLRILGNHEFDLGADSLATNLRNAKATLIATNYDLTDSPLAGMFRPYYIKEYDGKKIAFIAINLRPKGMISEGNYNGVEYLDAIRAANSTAWHLKHNEGVDMVIAMTHIGYKPKGTGTSDTELAAASEDIDLILGAHSHDVINPANPAKSLPWRLPDADGDERIPVTQSGKGGKWIGKVEIDPSTMAIADYSVILVDSRLDNHKDEGLLQLLQPYRHGVDSLMSLKVGRSAMVLDKESAELSNFVADFIRDKASTLTDKPVDFAIANKGGIRRGLPKGNVSEGQIINMLPFNNYIVVLELKGEDILENFRLMTKSDGNGVSSELDIVYYKPAGQVEGEIVSATINGQPIDPDKTYRVATIDYLANGGDYMEPLTHATRVAQSPARLYEDLLNEFRNGNFKRKAIKGESRVRMRPVDEKPQK